MNKAGLGGLGLLLATLSGGAGDASAPLAAGLGVQQSQSIEALIDSGALDQALDRLLARTRDGGGSRDDYLLMAEIYVRTGSGVAAEAAVDRARALGADYSATALLLAKANLLQGNYGDAIAVLDGVTIAPGDLAETLVVRADARFAQGAIEQAKALYIDATKADPRAFAPVLGLARVAMREQDLAAAEDYARQARDLSDGNTMAHYTLGLLARYRGEADKAKQAFQKAVDVYARNALALVELAAIAVDEGRIADAEALLDRVYAITSANPRARYLSAVILAEKGNFEEAHQLLSNLGAITNRFLPAAYVRGMVAYQVGRDSIARDYLSKVLAARPAHRVSRLTLASVETRSGRPGVALDILSPLIGEGSTDARAFAMAGAAAARAGQADLSQGYLARADALGEQVGDSPLEGLSSKLALAQTAAGDLEAAEATLSALVASNEADIRNLGLLADIQLRSGDLDAADDTAEKLVRTAPERGVGYNIRGTIAHRRGNFQAAVGFYDQAIARNKDYYTARRNRALANLMLGNDQAVEDDLERFLASQPDDARAKAVLGRAKLNLGQYDAALALFEAASRALGNSPDLQVDLVIARARAGYTAQAIRDSRSVMGRINERPDLLRKMGNLFLDLGQPQLAARPLARYQAFNPNSFDAAILHGRALFEGGLVTGSKLSFSRALALASDNRQKAVAQWYLFAAEVKSGDQASALTRLDQLDEDARPDSISRATIAEVYLIDGQLEAARAVYQRLFETMPTPDVARGYASALWQLDRQQDAVAVLKKQARSRSAVSTPLMQQLADYQLRLGDSDGAAATYERLIRQTGGSADTLVALALIYLQNGNVDAVRLAEQAYLIAPDDPAILSGYGWVLLQGARDVQRAFEVLEKAAKREPGNALYRYRLAMGYLARGNRVLARDLLQAALSLDPNFSEAEDARRQLALLG